MIEAKPAPLSIQVTATENNTRSCNIPDSPGHRKRFRFWRRRSRRGLNHLRLDLLLHVRDGLRADPKHPLLGDLPNKGPRHLHCYLRVGFLDMRRHRHVHAPRDAELDRVSRRVRDLCCRLRRLVDIHFLEGSGDQGHAIGSHHGVLCRRSQTSRCEKRVMVGKKLDRPAGRLSDRSHDVCSVIPRRI